MAQFSEVTAGVHRKWRTGACEAIRRVGRSWVNSLFVVGRATCVAVHDAERRGRSRNSRRSAVTGNRVSSPLSAAVLVSSSSFPSYPVDTTSLRQSLLRWRSLLYLLIPSGQCAYYTSCVIIHVAFFSNEQRPTRNAVCNLHA